MAFFIEPRDVVFALDWVGLGGVCSLAAGRWLLTSERYSKQETSKPTVLHCIASNSVGEMVDDCTRYTARGPLTKERCRGRGSVRYI
jgi:hypothetical protein